jgi:hypothetical protein
VSLSTAIAGTEPAVHHPDVAPWAADAARGLRFTLPLRFLFALLIPPLFTCIAVWCGYWHVVVTGVVMVLFTAFSNAVDRVLAGHPGLIHVKFLGPALELAGGLRGHYLENRPRGLLFYVFYPLCALAGAPFSAVIRKEARLYLQLFFVLGTVVVLDAALGYFSIYPPYLGWQDAAGILALELVITLYICVVYLMPMVSTAFTLSLAGKRTSLRILIAASLLLSIPAVYGGFKLRRTKISPTSQQLLKLRAAKPAFRGDMREASAMFLSYYLHVPVARIGRSTVPFAEPVLTQKYRRTINGITVRDERLAYGVFSFQETAGAAPQRFWLGVGGGGRVLYLASPEGRFFSAWAQLPPALQQKLVAWGLPAGLADDPPPKARPRRR